MFWHRSSLERKYVHFVSSSADGADLHPIGPGPRRLQQFGRGHRPNAAAKGGRRPSKGRGSARPALYAACPRESSWVYKMRLANSEIALSVVSGASRCGECPAPGMIVTSTGQ